MSVVALGALLLMAAPASALLSVSGEQDAGAAVDAKGASADLSAGADAAAAVNGAGEATAKAGATVDATTDYATATVDAALDQDGAYATAYAGADTAALCEQVPSLELADEATYDVAATAGGLTAGATGEHGIDAMDAVPAPPCPEASLEAEAEAEAGGEEPNVLVRAWLKIKALF